MLSKKQIILQALQGNLKQGVPWAPRMDIWFYSNYYRNTLPEEFRNLDLRQINAKLGYTYNKYLPDFCDGYKLEAVKDRLLGVFTGKDIPYEIKLDDSIERIVKNNNGMIEVCYKTSTGTVKGSFVMDESLKKQGSTLPPIKKHLINSTEDYRKVMEIFSSIKIIPKPENYRQLCARIGDEGHPAIFGHLAASPMQAILRDLMDPTLFFVEFKFNLPMLTDLCKDLEIFLLEIVKNIALCSSEPIILWGGNYDSMLTFPPFFKEYILPFLNKVCDIIHAKNGRIIGHCDGENNMLLELFKNSGMDILHAVNVGPAVTNSYREIRDNLREEQVISGGIPAVMLLKKSTSDKDFNNFLNKLQKNYRKGERLILEVSDNVPPDADMDRLKTIAEFANTL